MLYVQTYIIISVFKKLIFEAKGLLISKGLFDVIVSTKQPRTFLQGFLPESHFSHMYGPTLHDPIFPHVQSNVPPSENMH
jgi:hypothetical protein